MRIVWLYILGAVMVSPFNWTAATVANKPIDLIASDLLPLLMPFTYFFARSWPSELQLQQVKGRCHSYTVLPVLALIFIVYSASLAGIGLGMSGEMVRLYSAFKLAKPIGFVFLGLLIGSWADPLQMIGAIARVYGLLVAITMFCTVTAPEFPMGEWGRYIFELELGGYPNSPMSFYGALVPLLFAWVDSSKSKAAPLIGLGLAGCATLIILGSMSRSSALALFVGVVIYLWTTGRTYFLVVTFLVLCVLSLIGFGFFSIFQETEFVTTLIDRVQERIERSTETEDPSSGRFEIWSLAIELWTEQPVFGYMFESFSRYAEVDTPHQQYLEVLHKCGGLGLLVYLSMLASCLIIARRLIRVAHKGAPAWYFINALRAMLIALMIGNLTQPNLTYSVTGNLVFLLFGLLCSSRAVVTASQPVNLRIMRPLKPLQIHRAAA